MGADPENKPVKRSCVGLLAHVDAGKTTLSEGLLFRGGQLKRLGRVDHADSFLDTDAIERERGITIFSKMAVLPLEDVELTLLDTPGHVDFSAEMERTLQVLDCAVLVVSGTDGVQGHTLTLWRLLEHYRIPTFLFLNKMDLAGADRGALMKELAERLDGGCVDIGAPGWEEAAAMCSEEALEAYLETGTVPEEALRALVAGRRLFPCCFGAALKLEGVDALLEILARYAPRPDCPEEFSGRVYKIMRDPQGARLTFLKVTGGRLRVKDMLSGRTASGEEWKEKADQIRIYAGEKFKAVDAAEAGTVCAVAGLSSTRPGEGLGAAAPASAPVLEPVLSYQVMLPEGCEPHAAMDKLRRLEEEDPQLCLRWDARLKQISVRLMGEIQLEVLARLIKERFGLEVSFGPGDIVYRETIAGPVEGVGHFEPLRHYAEVHLLLEPLARGSGLEFAAACSEDTLDRNWQRLILTHLAEKQHLGVLTGSPITDMRLTLVAGRAHPKHTEGGDFRQATYRAVRQGLMEAESVLLEPWYDFCLELPAAQVGRAMTDLQQMGGRVEPPETAGEETVLTGAAPVAGLRGYARDVAAYTRGRGRLTCTLRGYEVCGSQAEAVSAAGYDPERDVENPSGSVFCDHGAGVIVPWSEARARMHVDSGLRLGERPQAQEKPERRRSSDYTGTLEQDQELQALFERTYGKVERKAFEPAKKPARTSLDEGRYHVKLRTQEPEYLLVDGYNIIYAWEELEAVARDSLDAARTLLMDLLSNYQGFRPCEVILVFDAYKVKGGTGSVERYHNIHVVYTREAETADAYIERATYELGKNRRVRVATSDGPEQLIILGHGALRVSASAFRAEVERVQGQIADILRRTNRPERSRPLQAAMEQARKKTEADRKRRL